MRRIEIDNELKEAMLFESYNAETIFTNIIAKATKEEPEETLFVKLNTKLGNLWFIKSGYTSQFVVRYGKDQFFAAPGHNMENIYVTMSPTIFNEAVEYLGSKEGKAYYKEMQAWLLSAFKKISKGASKPIGRIFDYPQNWDCIYDHYKYTVLAS